MRAIWPVSIRSISGVCTLCKTNIASLSTKHMIPNIWSIHSFNFRNIISIQNMINVKRTDSKQTLIWLSELLLVYPDFHPWLQGRTSGDGRGAENAHEVGRAQEKGRNWGHNVLLSRSKWWFQIFFIFTPTWGNDPIWPAYFSDGLKPRTSAEWLSFQLLFWRWEILRLEQATENRLKLF